MKAARLTAAVLVALTPAIGHADDTNAATPTEFEAPFDLFVNYVRTGDITVVLRNGDVLVDRAALAAAGLRVPGGVELEVGGRKRLSLRSVSPPLHYELDEREIALRIIAPPELLPPTVVDLRPAPRDLAYTNDPSAFFNYATQLGDAGNLSLYQETGLSFDRKLLLSAATISNTHAPVRGLTSLTSDDRPTLTRVTFGDTVITTGVLGGGAVLGGAAVARSYEIDPYALKLPQLGISGTTVAPATVDVYLNGARVRSEPIPPGPFVIDHLGITGGQGVATYVIRDAFGNEREINDLFYGASTLLGRGLHEYNYALGVLRENLGTESWDYRRPAAAGSHRVGVNDQLTLGGRGELMEARVSAGPSFAIATPVGQLDADFSASYDPAGAGAAAQLTHTYAAHDFAGSLYGQSTSNGYTTLDLTREDDRKNLEVGFSLSKTLAAVSLGYRAAVATWRDRGLSSDVSVRSGVELGAGLLWIASLSRFDSVREGRYWTVATTLSYGFLEKHRADLTGQISRGEPSARLEVSKAMSQAEDYGFRAAANLREQASADLTAQYQVPVGRYAARYTLRDTQSLSLEAAGALVVVPGVGIFPTLPVQGAFGVIQLEGLPGVRGYGNGQEVGRTDRNGNLMVPNLLAYYGNRLSIEPIDVPVENELTATELVLAPPPRGVAIARFPVRRPQFLRGVVVVMDQGRRVVPEYGQVVVTQGESQVVSPLGAMGEFELDGLIAGTQRWLVEYAGGTCELEVVGPTSAETVVELGEVTCTKSTPEASPEP